MIAESRARQKGCATEALKLMMGYCYDKIRISKFVAKIGKHNLKSYSLFKNKVRPVQIDTFVFLLALTHYSVTIPLRIRVRGI